MRLETKAPTLSAGTNAGRSQPFVTEHKMDDEISGGDSNFQFDSVRSSKTVIPNGSKSVLVK